MNKRVICLIIVLLLLLPSIVYAEEISSSNNYINLSSSKRVYDESKLFNANEIDQLDVLLKETSEKWNIGIYIVTVDSTKGQDIGTFAENFFDSHDFGVGEKKEGVELVLKMTGGVGNRDYYVDGHGALGQRIERSFDDESFLKYLRNNNYYNGAYAFVNEVARCAEFSTPVGKVKSLLPAFLLAGAVIALIVVLVMRSGMKTAKARKNAQDYMLNDTFRLTRSLDIYLYKTTTRTRIAESSGSGSHSGGHSSGGHSGHGGKF